MSARRYLDEKTGAHPFDHDADGPRPNVIFITADMIPPESYAPLVQAAQYVPVAATNPGPPVYDVCERIGDWHNPVFVTFALDL